MTRTPARRGFSVRVFLPDGDPDGIKVVEKSNWTGCGLAVRRALFGEARRRPELARPGVYLLVGNADISPLPQLYVGEGDPVRHHLEQHAKTKQFWTHAVVSIHTYTKDIRAELVQQGVLTDRGTAHELAQDYTFSSPSTAVGVFLGRSLNGRIEGKTAGRRTFKSIQDAQASA